MSRAKIFLHRENEGSLRVMHEKEWLQEKDLQKFLARYPDLIPGEQIDSENPRRWFLVSREMGVPREEGQRGWWSLDHLFLDQDGIPTFIECKRASDNRARREVVAQMLDYAANAIRFWNSDRIRQAASETLSSRDESLDEALGEFLDLDIIEESEIEAFWEKVQVNLEEKRIRLMFVINRVPTELKRIVEFLNEEMEHTEVLAVEIKRFKQSKDDRSVLVPRVLGLTEKAKEKKKSSASTQSPTSRPEFLNKCDSISQKFFRRVFDRAEESGYKIRWGTVGFSLRVETAEDEYGTFTHGYPPDKFNFYFGRWIREDDDIDEKKLRENILDFGLLEESGKCTLKTRITEENIDDLNELYDYILEKIEEIKPGNF